MRALIACDWETFPSSPGQPVCNLEGDMHIEVPLAKVNTFTKEIRNASDAENYRRTVEWVRAQRLGR